MNKWYEIKNQASEYSDVYIFNDIGTFGITAQKFVDDIKNPEIVTGKQN